MTDNDDPFLRPEPTMLRPRPGGARRGPQDPPTLARPAAQFEPETMSAAVRARLGLGLNPLVRAASPLLILTGQLRSTLQPMDVSSLRRHALEEIRQFESQAQAASIANDIVVAARYALCASLDEAVLSTPWGSQSEWAQHTLLVALHRETWGGEKFFEMLDRISADPTRYIDLMELQYLNLAFGFEGKYHVLERGHERLAEVQRELYRKIRSHRGVVDPELSLRWRGLEDRRNRLIRYVPWWVVGAATLAVLAVAFTVYYANLAQLAAPVHAELAKVGLEEFPLPAPAPAPGPTLKQLLAPEEAAGALTVEETGARTLVTLLGDNLFDSGSATVNQAYQQMLQRVADALNKVPGRVTIVGHTDDQAISSFRYPNNFALSRDRAASVAKVLQQTLSTTAQLTLSGVGSSQPRYRPESTPENRSRNRRVEIIHVRGA